MSTPAQRAITVRTLTAPFVSGPKSMLNCASVRANSSDGSVMNSSRMTDQTVQPTVTSLTSEMPRSAHSCLLKRRPSLPPLKTFVRSGSTRCGQMRARVWIRYAAAPAAPAAAHAVSASISGRASSGCKRATSGDDRPPALAATRRISASRSGTPTDMSAAVPTANPATALISRPSGSCPSSIASLMRLALVASVLSSSDSVSHHRPPVKAAAAVRAASSAIGGASR